MSRPARPLLVLCLVAVAAAGCRGREPVYALRRLTVDPAGGGDATISPDGRRFVTTSRRSGNWDLWVYDIAEGRWTQLTDDPADDFEGKWSPDGRQLAFTSTRGGGKDVWVLSLAGGRSLRVDGAPRRLTSSPEEEEYPAWSPDGRQIAYSGGPWGARDFWLVPAAGGAPRKLTPRPGWAGACTFGARGESLVCHRYDLGSGDVQRLWLDDGETTPLTQGADWDYKPAESPDGRWLAFSRSREGPSGIWLMPAGGGRAQPLTAALGEDRWPTWSAAGDRLFFHRLIESGTAVKRLDRMTGRVTTLVGAAERPQQASLDPAGQRLVYCAERDGRRVLRMLDLARGTTRTLPTGGGGGGEACFPRFSPDGGSIAFAARGPERWEVAVLRADGSGRRTLTAGIPGLRGLDGSVDWSPDGERLLFHSDTRAFEASLFTVEVATRRLARLTSDAWFDEAPSWTPDGRGVLFMSTRGGDWTWGLFRLAVPGGGGAVAGAAVGQGAGGALVGQAGVGAVAGQAAAIEVFAGPDYEEKNYPRAGAGGAIFWSAVDGEGVERIVERGPAGKVRVWAGTEGGRWPSVSSDGRHVLFTTIEKRVEYWLADNPTGRGSPVTAPRLPARGAAVPAGQVAAFNPTETELRTGAHTSPVDLHHR